MRLARTLALILLASLAAAAPPATTLDASQKALYQKLCQSLIAPCCWREPVAIHRSAESLQVRDEIAEMILAGKSEREIRDDFVARYGTRILIEPQGSRAQWLYLIPIGVLFLAALAAAWFLRRKARPARPAGDAVAGVDDSEWDW